MSQYQELENIENKELEKKQENSNQNCAVLNRLNKYFSLLNEFERVREDLKNQTRGYLDSMLKLIKYKFTNPVKDPNFFHYASEAWLLSVFKNLRTVLHEDLNQGKDYFSITFNDLLEKIYQLKIDEECFIDYLDILLGTYKVNDHIIKITQIKMSGIFLKKIEQAKEMTIQKKINENIKRKEFEEIIFLILKKALNFTLNDLNSQEQDKNSLLYLNVYTEMRKVSSNELTMQLFLNEINKSSEKCESKSNISEVELLNPTSTFYNFANISLVDLLKDIKTFNVNSSNLIEKIKFLFSSNYSRAKHLVKYTYRYINLKSADNRVFALMNNILDRSVSQSQALCNFTGNNFKEIKTWFAPKLNKYFTTSKNVFNYCTNFYTIISDQIVKVIQPVKNILVLYYENSVRIILNAKTWTLEEVRTFYTQICKSFSCGKGLRQVVYDQKEKVFHIIIENHQELLKTCPRVKSVEDWILEKVQYLQKYDFLNVINNFKRILSLAPEEEKSKKENISETSS